MKKKNKMKMYTVVKKSRLTSIHMFVALPPNEWRNCIWMEPTLFKWHLNQFKLYFSFARLAVAVVDVFEGYIEQTRWSSKDMRKKEEMEKKIEREQSESNCVFRCELRLFQLWCELSGVNHRARLCILLRFWQRP